MQVNYCKKLFFVSSVHFAFTYFHYFDKQEAAFLNIGFIKIQEQNV